MRKFLLLVSLIVFSAVATLGAEDLTLPAAASIVGGRPVLLGRARLQHVLHGQPGRARCATGASSRARRPTTDIVTFTLTPRESRAFNDIVRSQFHDAEQRRRHRVRALRERRPARRDEPALLDRAPAHGRHVHPRPAQLGGVPDDGADLDPQRRDANAGFRTNVGVFNREDSAVDVTFRIFDGGAQVGNSVTINVAAHAGAQVNRIFTAAGQDAHATENAVIVVSASHEIFSYAAVIDNNTTDPIFVVGAEDEPFQETTPTGPTQTPTVPGPTVTPTVPGPTVTPTPPVGGTRTVNVGQGRNELRRSGQRQQHVDDHRRDDGQLGLGRRHSQRGVGRLPALHSGRSVQLRQTRQSRRNVLAHVHHRGQLSPTSAPCTIRA